MLKRTWAEIDLNAIRTNYKKVCDQSNACNVWPVVKADAYGHGAVKISQVLQSLGADGFAVSNIEEAEELRSAGILNNILILGYTPPDMVKKLVESGLIQAVYSLEYAKQLNDFAIRAGVIIQAHLKLDTGMGRIGFDCRNKNLNGLIQAEEALRLSNISYTGIFTHFAVADSNRECDKQFTELQYELFDYVVKELEHKGHYFKTKHCCNSAALLQKEYGKFTTVRAGIIIYGLEPSNDAPIRCEFLPAMSLYSVISMIKIIREGESVGYVRTYVAQKETKIATVSAGYADGVPRLLSNKGYVFISGKKAPIIGNICMDQFCVDVSEIEDVQGGDLVEIFGKNISVNEVAAAAQTINYEIVCGITKRVPRVFINETEREK